MFKGIGSNPPLFFGLHLTILFKAKIVPLKMPNSLTARTAYVEHEGVNLHVFGRQGDMINLYKYIKQISNILKG